MNRRTVHFAGHVQGVGFRYITQGIVRRHREIGGYVRNLTDGRVELVMEGPAEQMDQIIEAIGQQMGVHIHKVTTDLSQATGEFAGFSIRH